MSLDEEYLRLSPSGIATWTQCPRKWSFNYIHQIREPSGVAPLEGTFAHSIMETVLAEDPKDRTLEFAKKAAQELWEDKNLIGSGYQGEYETLSLEDEAERAFKWQAWLGVQNAFDLVNPASIEVIEVEMDIEEEVLPNTWFKGFVDLLEDTKSGPRITDWKLSKPPIPRYREDKIIQLRLYAAVLWEKGLFEAKRTRLVFMRKSGSVVETNFSKHHKDKTLEYFEETAVEIRSAKKEENFPTKTGPLCGWCYYLPTCKEGKAWLKKKDRVGQLPSYISLEQTPEQFKKEWPK